VFEQTFVTGPQQARKPAAVALSLAAQATAVAVLAALPLIYTPTLPLTRFRDFVVARAPEQPPARHSAPRTEARPTLHIFAFQRLITPSRVPAAVHQEPAIPGAPDIGSAMGVPSDGGAGINSLVADVPKAAPAPAASQRKNPGPVRIGGKVAGANLIRSVQPVYPALARSARVQGTVEFTATISKEGNIENLTLVRGHPLLVAAAREAVSQWKYRPTLLNGQPVEVITDITVNFMLSP